MSEREREREIKRERKMSKCARVNTKCTLDQRTLKARGNLQEESMNRLTLELRGLLLVVDVFSASFFPLAFPSNTATSPGGKVL